MSATRYEDALAKAAEERPELVVLTAENRAAIRTLPGRLGTRFVDVGICEQTMIGAAAGLALRGRVPVVHALATFLTMRAFEFIRTDIGIPCLPVKLVSWVPGFLSEANGPTHQAIEDIALMRLVPGMQIFSPGDEDELLSGIPAVLSSPSPVYVRYVARKAASAHAPFRWGRAEVVGEGRDVAVLTHGLLLTEAVEAVGLLRAEGLSLRLVNLRTLEPLDTAAVLAAARVAKLVVTLEDHRTIGGLFSLVAETCARHGLAPRILALGLERFFAAALLPDVLRHEGFTAPDIARRIRDAVSAGPRAHALSPAVPGR